MSKRVTHLLYMPFTHFIRSAPAESDSYQHNPELLTAGLVFHQSRLRLWFAVCTACVCRAVNKCKWIEVPTYNMQISYTSNSKSSRSEVSEREGWGRRDVINLEAIVLFKHVGGRSVDRLHSHSVELHREPLWEPRVGRGWSSISQKEQKVQGKLLKEHFNISFYEDQFTRRKPWVRLRCHRDVVHSETDVVSLHISDLEKF